MIEAKDLDAAIAIAARIPGARLGSIEVRPIGVSEEYAAAVDRGAAGAGVKQ